jgi:hypothetical protein
LNKPPPPFNLHPNPPPIPSKSWFVLMAIEFLLSINPQPSTLNPFGRPSDT